MQTPFLHRKHRNSSELRKIFNCRDHKDCSHRFTVIEGNNDDNVLSSLCFESGIHPNNSTIGDVIRAPPRGIHPTIKAQIDEWIRDINMKPSLIIFNLEKSSFASSHQLPTLQQVRQYKADVSKSIGVDLTTLSSFREFMNIYKVY